MRTKISVFVPFSYFFLLFVASGESSVLKEVRNNLPILDSSLRFKGTFRLDTVIPRRDDDYTVLADGDEALEFITTEKPLSSSSSEIDDEPEEKTTENPLIFEEANRTNNSDAVYAVFGLNGFRPVFPEFDADLNGNVSYPKENKTSTFSTNLPPLNVGADIGLVDIKLAQLANINVFASNVSQVDVFASKSGLNCSCGSQYNSTDQNKKIVNGVPVKINTISWTAALFKKNWIGFYGSKPYCGGSLINSKYILTASHCVEGMQARSLKVRLYEEDLTKLNENEEGFQEFLVSEIKMHEGYNRRTIDNDVALLKLSKAVELKEGGIISPVCLPASDKNDLTSYEASVAGFGAISQGGSLSQVLRQVQVPIISNEVCNTKTVYKSKISANMLCAGLLETGGKDACQGDSGGPLIIDNAGRKTLVGVVSWGYGCAKKDAPGVYARVGRYSDWILENTKESEWCSS